jgi:transglutaminase-like putative cysteine protease
VVSITSTPSRAGITRHFGYWRLTSALLLVLLGASISLTGLISGPGWWFLMLFIGSTILLFAAGLRTVGVPRSVVPALEILLLLVVLTIGFGGSTAPLGIVPTGATLGQFAQLIGQARVSIYEQSSPAPPLPELLFLIALGTGVFVIILDVVAITLRRPVFAGLAVAMVIAAPALLSAGVIPATIAASGVAFLYLLRSDVRTRHPETPPQTAALSIGALSVVVALVLAVSAPGFVNGGTTSFSASGISIGSSVTPLIDIGQDLRRPAAIQTLTYTTDSSQPPYLKLTSLDEFTGSVWKHSPAVTKPLPGGNTIGPAVGLAKDVKTTKVTTTIHIDDMMSEWLPAPSPVVGVHGLSGTWSWDPRDLTIGAVNSGTSTRGQSYTAVSLEIEPTAQQLEQAGGVTPVDIRKDLAIPRNLPSIITQTALTATAGATSEYVEAVDLQNYFRDNGFVYSVNTPLKQGYDGDGEQVIAKFLQVKSGYCVHFASAMAIMARTLGIPSRVAMGYLPGASDSGSANGPSAYTVTSDDLHAWPELYFAGVGWVPFEPTVGQGTIPTYTLPSSGQIQSAPAPLSTSAPSHGGLGAKLSGHGSSGSDARSRAHVQPVASWLVFGALAVAILLIPALVRGMRRRSRLRRLADGTGIPADGWRELIDSARDIGWSITDTETPRAFAARVSSVLVNSTQSDAMVRLLAEFEREEFGPPGFSGSVRGLAKDVELLVEALQSSAGHLGRIRATVFPASLIPEAWQSPTGVRAAKA